MNMSGAYIPKELRWMDKAGWAQMSKAPLRPLVGAVVEGGDCGLKFGQLLMWLVFWQRLYRGKTNPGPLPRLAE